MRKAIIAAIVATALFAVGAFAASFAVDSEDIASGADPVDACAELVRITFNEPQPASSTNGGGRWTVSQATATFYSNAAATSPASACVGFDASLALDIDNLPVGDLDGDADTVVSSFAEDTVELVGSNVVAVFTISSPTTYVDEVVGASVVVDDAFIDAATDTATVLD
jgi:hypothetical protein